MEPNATSIRHPAAASDDVLRVTPIGAGNEVGRSCIILSFKGKNIMLDCGIHPAYQGIAALPFFDEIEPENIDMVLITHFHLDHVASLPYFLEKTNFKGKVFMTHPSKAIYKWLLLDFVKVSNISPDDALFDEKDLMRSYEKITAVDYHQEVDVEGVKFTCYNAGHVLGAAMFLIEIAGVKILYTGDYSREEDRHLLAAEMPPGRSPDVMICESTYGVQSHEPRMERERRFTSLVHEIVNRGGRCLLPVFALGKAQELLLILDEYWQAHPELQSVPIYYASSLAKKCLAIYQTYLNMMNPNIRKQMTGGSASGMEDGASVANPFVFKHISNIRNMEGFDDAGPCVMMASPGMLQNGLSRELFEAWCTDKRNGVIIPGYSVEGTLAKLILTEPSEITAMNGTKLPLRMSVEYISFSAHVDFIQNSQFIDALKPRHLVLVHGEMNEMNRLRSALQHKYDERESDGTEKTTIHCPRNCESVELTFHAEQLAKAMGSLAREGPKEGKDISGLLVGKDFEFILIQENELTEYTTLKTSSVRQRQWLQSHCPFSLVEYHIVQLFGSKNVASTSVDGLRMLTIMRDITVEEKTKGRILLQWSASPMMDLMADSVVTQVLTAESSPMSIKLSQSHSHSHSHSHGYGHSHDHDHDHTSHSSNENKASFEQLLNQYFDHVAIDDTDVDLYHLIIDTQPYSIHLKTMAVTGPEEKIVTHLQHILALYTTAMSDTLLIPPSLLST